MCIGTGGGWTVSLDFLKIFFDGGRRRKWLAIDDLRLSIVD